MLVQRHFSQRHPRFVFASKQRGVVLLIAFIILVALTLSAVALMRSVDTTNLIAGNMSFNQSAVHAGERSTELAVNNWLQLHLAATDVTLHADHYDVGDKNGYRAVREDPAAGVSWDTFWNATLKTQAVEGAQDSAGNTVSYVIHRLCDAVGPPHKVNCSKPPTGGTGGSFSAGGPSPIASSQVYYRITTRIAGPRNTVAYIQTIVAL
jgi:type IV pilus assembly protein PilX